MTTTIERTDTRVKIHTGNTYQCRNGNHYVVTSILPYSKRPVIIREVDGYITHALYKDGHFLSSNTPHPLDIVGTPDQVRQRRIQGEDWDLQTVVRIGEVIRHKRTQELSCAYRCTFLHPDKHDLVTFIIHAPCLSEATTNALNHVKLIRTMWREARLEYNRNRHRH